MKNIALIPFLVLFLLWGCKGENQGSETPEQAEEKADSPEPAMETASTKPSAHFSAEHQASSYSFFVEADNGEMTQVHVYTKGMEHEYDETIGIEGQVLESFMLDLNGDGFKEYYLTILPTDDSGNINLMGFGSNRGKSISQIYVRDPAELRAMHTDKVMVDRGKLVRTFESNGQKLTYIYRLFPGEAGYILQAEEVSE